MATGLYVSIMYGLLQCVVAILLSVIIFISTKRAGEAVRCSTFFTRLWEMRGVYAPLIVHIYDTATGAVHSLYVMEQNICLKI